MRVALARALVRGSRSGAQINKLLGRFQEASKQAVQEGVQEVQDLNAAMMSRLRNVIHHFRYARARMRTLGMPPAHAIRAQSADGTADANGPRRRRRRPGSSRRRAADAVGPLSRLVRLCRSVCVWMRAVRRALESVTSW